MKVLFTGGGTAGHVTPNMALIEKLREENAEISYIGSENGIEKGLIEKMGYEFQCVVKTTNTCVFLKKT